MSAAPEGAPVEEGLLKPHYRHRPGQALRRLLQTLSGSPPPSAEVVLPWGLRLKVDPRESIGGGIWRLGLYDLAVSEALWRLTAPGDLAVDVGANLGHMTGILALRAGPSGRVLAFEPHPGVHAELRENAARAGADRRTAPIEVFAQALGAAAGVGHLDCGDPGSDNRGLARLVAAGGGGLPVPVTTLDAALAGRTAGVVKVDVEGAAGEVFEGGAEALRSGRIRHLVYEAHDEEREPLAARLRGAGYAVLALGRDHRGLIVGTGGEAPRLPRYEAPSYLAVREPEGALRALRGGGWRVFSRAARR